MQTGAAQYSDGWDGSNLKKKKNGTVTLYAKWNLTVSGKIDCVPGNPRNVLVQLYRFTQRWELVKEMYPDENDTYSFGIEENSSYMITAFLEGYSLGWGLVDPSTASPPVIRNLTLLYEGY
jgi:hypothetical protein